MTRYFGTDGIRGKFGQALINPEFVLKLGWAAGKVLGAQGGSKVLIGKDTRISGYLLESALEAGLSAAGVNILLLGPMPTPAIAYLTRTLRAQAGIVISASHNPYDDNGIKFFNAEGSKLSRELELSIEARLEEKLTSVTSAQLGKAERVNDAAGRYIEFCKSTFPTRYNLKGFKMVVDCAHGATYHIAPEVFHELGAEVISIGNSPNGLNINENYGSTHPERLRQEVLAHEGCVGIALDGDGDRLIMVDEVGEIVDGDELLFLMIQQYHQQGSLVGGVVGTDMTNQGLEEELVKRRIPFLRTRVGDRYVMSTLKQEGWQLGGEPSGHIVHLGLTTTGDGIVSALQVLSALVSSGKTLHELKKGMVKWPNLLVNIPLQQPLDLQHPTVKNAVSTYEKLLQPRGRLLLRPSGTEPVVRLMVEADEESLVSRCAYELSHIIQSVMMEEV